LIRDKKCHILVDWLGLLLHALVTAADIQDRDGGVLLLSTLFGHFPFLRKLFADSAYTGRIFRHGVTNAMPLLALEIVKRRNQSKGFVVEPQRWLVERTIGCLNRCRRLAKDWESRNALASSASRQSALCFECSVIPDEVLGRTLDVPISPEIAMCSRQPGRRARTDRQL
jgi:transposase